MPRLGFCGDNCDLCPRHVATQSDDEKELKKVAVLWYEVGYRDRIVPSEELICHGCSSTMCNREDRRVVRDCASAKEVENCGKCEDYPCAKVPNVFEQVELFAKNIKGKCSKEEYESLRKAFFSKKKKNLDRVSRQWRSQAKRTAPG